MAERETKIKKVMSLEAKQRKRERDKYIDKTRVNIGPAYARWKSLKEATKSRSDGDLALLLLDCYKQGQDTSSSSKSCGRKGSSKLPVSSIKEECDQDQDVPANQHELGVQRLPEEKETSLLKASYKQGQDTSSSSKSCDRKGSPKLPVSSIKEECDQDQDVPANQHELGVQRLPEEKETSRLEASCSFLSNGVESHLQRPERSSSVDFCHDGPSDKFMSSTNEDQDSSVGSSVQSPAPGQELEKEAATCQSLTSSDEQKTKENDKNRVQDDEDEELITSISVGDRQVDLGSSSEIIVDEECILQLFESCRKCNKKCTVRKHVDGLKIVVNQVCCFCESHFEWTNLPDDKDSDFQVNEQNSVTSQNSKTGS